MFMRMIYDEGLAQAAYLIGCQRSGEAIVIDPERDVDRYVDLAAANGLRIVAAAETHIHADFVSGSRELAQTHGAKVYVSGEGGPDWQYSWLDKKPGGGVYDHQLLHDGDAFRVGNIGFKVVHTPGHTPEHIVFLVTDHGAGADAPVGVASGDFVFVGDLGRPDLLETAAGQVGDREPSARRLYQSVRTLDDIPEFVQVWPGHGAGSACGKALGAVPTSTVGYEKRFNPAIRAATGEQAFVDYILSGQPEPPLYFARMKRINREGPPVLSAVPAPPRLPGAALREDPGPRGVIVDTRPWEAFRESHVAGSLSFPLITSFCTDAGSMLKETDELVLIADPDDLDTAVRQLVRIGLDRIRGWVDATDPAVISAGTGSREVDVAGARRMLDEGSVRVLDVRRATEFEEGHIPGAINCSHTRLADHLAEIPTDRPVLVNCRSGVRSARATALLERAGHDVTNLRGGFLAWDRDGAPVER